MARVVQVLLCSVAGPLTPAQVIADVDISTIVHSPKVERGTKRRIISYTLSMRVDKRVMLKRSSCIPPEDNFEKIKHGANSAVCTRENII